MFSIEIAAAISVKSYAEKYHISVQSVYSKIRRKGEMLKGHIFRLGGKTVLDDYAQEILMPSEGNLRLAEKADNLQNCLENKSAETEKCRDEISRLCEKNALLEMRISEKKAEIDELKNRVNLLTEKLTDFENYQNRLDKIFALLEEAAGTGIGKKLGNMLKNQG